MIARVRKAERPDVEGVVRVLVRAFDDDPIMNWICRQDGKRREAFDRLSSLTLCKLSLPFGEVLVTDDRVGAALWVPPEKWKMGFFQQLSILPTMARVIGLPRFLQMLTVLNAGEKVHPPDAHYYLLQVGVDPSRQGEGIGSALLTPVLERCDQERCGAYLENTNPENLSFYERHGFEVIGMIDLGPKAPPLSAMWRKPRT